MVMVDSPNACWWFLTNISSPVITASACNHYASRKAIKYSNKTYLLPILPRKWFHQKERYIFIIHVSVYLNNCSHGSCSQTQEKTHIPPPLTSCTSSTIPRVSPVHDPSLPPSSTPDQPSNKFNSMPENPAARIDNLPSHGSGEITRCQTWKERWWGIIRNWYAQGLADTLSTGKLYHHLRLLGWEKDGEDLLFTAQQLYRNTCLFLGERTQMDNDGCHQPRCDFGMSFWDDMPIWWLGNQRGIKPRWHSCLDCHQETFHCYWRQWYQDGHQWSGWLQATGWDSNLSCNLWS